MVRIAFATTSNDAPGRGGRFGRHGETISAEALASEQRDVEELAFRSVERLVSKRFGLAPPLLYARVDLVRLDDGSHVVLEAGPAEPAFYLATDPEAPERFARPVMRQEAGLKRAATVPRSRA